MIRYALKPAVLARSINREFWTVGRLRSIGYIESVYKAGLIFESDYIKFRETSSNLSNGEQYTLSTSYLNPEIKHKLEKIMNRKVPVCIEYYKDLVGSPLSGDIFDPCYVTDIHTIEAETIHTKTMNVTNLTPLPNLGI